MPHIRKHLTPSLLAVALAAAGLTALPVTAAQAAWSGGDGLLATASDYGTIIGNPDGTDLTYLNPPDGAAYASWSPNGRFLAYENIAGSTGIEISEPDGTGSVNVPGANPSDSHVSFYGDGAMVTFAQQSGPGADPQLYVAPSDGTRSPRPLFPNLTGSCDSYASGGPGYILFDRQASGCTGTTSVWAYDTETKTSTLLVDNALQPDISPDGTKIVFVRSVDSVNQLFTANIDGSDVTELTADDHGSGAGYNEPVWSPTGAEIAFSSQDQGNQDTEILNVSTLATTVWAPVSWGSPSWQPVVAQPTALGTDLPIAYESGSGLVVNPDNGTPARTIATSDVNGNAVWDSKGNRLIFSENDALYSTLANGTGAVQITVQDTSGILEPAVAPSGDLIVFQRGGDTLYVASTDGTYEGNEYPVPGIDTASGEVDGYPTIAADYSILYERDLNGSSDVYRDADGVSKLYIANAMQPTYSPDRTKIAFVRPDADGIDQIFTVAANGVSDLTQVTHDATDDSNPAWSPDGTQIAYSNFMDFMVFEVSATTGTVLGSIAGASWPSFEPSAPGQVVRLWGGTAIGTAIAASQYNWATVGTVDARRGRAQAVVLSRSDEFYDALAGSALATAKDAPLLITPPAQLESPVLAEIRRVLPAGGTVYLLGGTAALSPAVANAVAAAGFRVDRLAGGTEYATAVAVDQTITTHPSQVMVATGRSYYDALSAGAAAGADGAVVVLTDNATIPAASAAYLDTINPNTVAYMAIGGPGEQALQYDSYATLKWGTFNFYYLVGGTAKDTALLVAENYFTAPTDVAVATDHGWYDALSGGAMVGARGGPLLLTDPTGLYGPDATYLEKENFSLARIAMLGGPAALPLTLDNPIGATFGTPWDYTSFQPGSPEVPFASHVGVNAAPMASTRVVKRTAGARTVR
jgi:Tol biopolymer transport system component